MIANCKRQKARAKSESELPSANCQVPSANCRVPTAKCQLPSANCQVLLHCCIAWIALGWTCSFWICEASQPPPSALTRVNFGHHLLAQQLRRQSLVAQQRRLRGDHVEVAGDAADIAVVGDLQRATRVGDRGVLCARGLRQFVQSRQAVFHLLKGDQHGLAIVGHRLVVGVSGVRPGWRDCVRR